MKKRFSYFYILLPLLVLLTGPLRVAGQTDIDAIMMEKKAFCVGPMYSHSSWKNYWEGNLKRENLNIGRVSTNVYSLMGNYGVSRNLNLLFSIPYIQTKASAGTMKGMQGIQDLSLFAKWRAYHKRWGNGILSLYGIAGLSLPVNNYVADYLPLSIGLKSKTAAARIMGDYLQGKLFVTGSATYVLRSNMEIDRNSYYTTQLHLTNKVAMPDAMNFNFRAGYRSFRLIAEAVVNNWTTLGGFDITRNNMPFPSNRMNATTAGINIKYVIPSLPQLSIVTGGNVTVAGRNMGQTSTVYGSLFYVLDLNKKERKADESSIKN